MMLHFLLAQKYNNHWFMLGPCTNCPIVFPLQIEERKSKNDFSVFNKKMNCQIVFQLYA